MLRKLTIVSGCSLWLLFVIYLSGCVAKEARSSSTQKQGVSRNAVSPQPYSLQDDTSMRGVGGGLGRIIEAWKQLTADGRYRLANENDFTFSEAARRSTIDIERWVKHPFLVNDFNDDYISKDLAVIIVDTTRTNPERFGLVIFNAPADTDKESVPQPHWVYRERDLSTAFLGYSRDGLDVTSYKEDGTFTLCHVKWNKARHEYDCK